jgi:hypothetical protein
MHYSLSNRFRGALLGALLGEYWGYLNPTNSKQDLLLFDPNTKDLAMLTPLQWSVSNGILSSTKGLIQGKLWIDIDPSNGEKTSSQNLRLSTLSGILLPIALFFHDDEESLRQAIALWKSDVTMDSDLADFLFIFAYSIALALREQLEPINLIPHVLTHLKSDPDTTLVGQRLIQVQHLLNKRVSLAALESFIKETLLQHPDMGSSHPSSDSLIVINSIAIALYGFISTSEDFRLTVMRSKRLDYCPQIVCALAGALSGAYGGVAGIPISWRRALQLNKSEPSLTNAWTVPSESTLFEMTDQLLATWLGIYNPKLKSDAPLVAAAPRVIRPNSPNGGIYG